MNFVVDFFTIMQPIVLLALVTNIVNIVLQIVVSAFTGRY